MKSYLIIILIYLISYSSYSQCRPRQDSLNIKKDLIQISDTGHVASIVKYKFIECSVFWGLITFKLPVREE